MVPAPYITGDTQIDYNGEARPAAKKVLNDKHKASSV